MNEADRNLLAALHRFDNAEVDLRTAHDILRRAENRVADAATELERARNVLEAAKQAATNAE